MKLDLDVDFEPIYEFPACHFSDDLLVPVQNVPSEFKIPSVPSKLEMSAASHLVQCEQRQTIPSDPGQPGPLLTRGGPGPGCQQGSFGGAFKDEENMPGRRGPQR